jgi:hypothetical protein
MREEWRLAAARVCSALPLAGAVRTKPLFRLLPVEKDEKGNDLDRNHIFMFWEVAGPHM